MSNENSNNDRDKLPAEVTEPLLHSSNNKPEVQQLSDHSAVKNDETTDRTTIKETSRRRAKSVSIQEKKTDKWDLVPPDGGWGWLVLFGATLVNVLVPGTLKSFGVLFVQFKEQFSATNTVASWIPALAYFLYSSLGPVSSLLSIKYSYRTVTIAGGTFTAVGMILSFYANSIYYLYLSYGVLVGIGAGLSFPPTVYIVTSYFVRLRGLANGICISGSALGSIIIPPILTLIIQEYGYRGAVLLMGGAVFNVWVAALFYEPVSKHLKKVPKKAAVNNEDTAKPEFLLTEESMGSLNQVPRNDSFIDNLDVTSNAFNRSVSSAAVQNMKTQNRERKISMPTSRSEVMKARYSTGSSRSNITSLSALHSVPEDRNTAMDLLSQNRLPVSRRQPGMPKRSPSTSSFQYVSTPFHGSTLTLQPETFASTFSLGKKQVKEEDIGKKFFDISVLKDPMYLIILISNATNAISYTNFIILLPDYAKSLGFDEDKGAFLLSIVSALDLVGRIGGSALSDVTVKVRKEWYFIGGLGISGISLAILPFFKDYAVLGTFCAFFGLASGVYVGITAVIMTDLLGEEKLQSTYGISLLLNGILQLAGPPLCGVYVEVVKSYTSLFCLLGICLIVGTSIWGVVPCIKKKSSTDDE